MTDPTEPTAVPIAPAEADRIKTLLTLQKLSRELAAEHNLPTLLDRVMDAIVQLTGAERGFMILVEPDDSAPSEPGRPGTRHVIRVARNMKQQEVAEPEMAVSHSIATRVIESGTALITSNAVDDARLSNAKSVLSLELRSIFCIALKFRDRVIGAVYLDNRMYRGAFSDALLEPVSSLAAHAAIAIENARLIDRIESLNSQLSLRVEEQDRELAQARVRIAESNEKLQLKHSYDSIVCTGEAMRKLLKQVDRVTDTDLPVLILGESGTGKELMAQTIHYNSPRKVGPFVSENMAAIPETLVESELFGYVKGAFTGADSNKIGLIELASGGTLFLDEIGELPYPVQAKLLRVLAEREVRPIGAKAARKIDIRVISATNRDLQAGVESGRFREDLLFRINVVSLQLPPLRDRREDIPVLVERFVASEAGKKREQPPVVEAAAMRLLTRYRWPGNIRELLNEVQRAMALREEEGRITAADLRREIADHASNPSGVEWEPGYTLKERVDLYERTLIDDALKQNKNNKTNTAKALGISRRGLFKKLEKHYPSPGKRAAADKGAAGGDDDEDEVDDVD